MNLWEIAYQGNTDTLPYFGLIFKSEDDFKNYLKDRVFDKLKDTKYFENLADDAIQSMKDTGFEVTEIAKDKIKEDFQLNINIKDWLIGEYLAESILEDHFDVKFFYNHLRSAKNPNANLTGTDIIGFCDIENKIHFVFGEVKTSSDKNCPPSVMSGRHQMEGQLDDLINSTQIKKDLIRYIFDKANLIGGEFKDTCSKAMGNYYTNKKFKLFGVLVRDTDPNSKDLKGKAAKFKETLPASTKLDFIAIYSAFKMDNKNWLKAMEGGDN